ncbi:single-stranded-DNA-specific exonuclease RecJ [Brevibacillus reuszeri]|uniref:Single-stranded-DNA-specific exonuclease RecJ n=1 Tax=Brevibacillus reuszeri TaxID=54915 RepID=A0A0K9YZ10_9BACL|nr:single-stranded-DNA-specific exonuclease RecJ [Brevibacillus reuszeri]KNB73939.1 recombinase RecJ [Brevibacillus reuszeri]MED1859905.1 single-stranded-DNA-specific exonuclease RecJ [Brevibacillus reuszeri]GED70981.1 single-stranded-DNA-specific exonuclease RecJ [Brevibacillus reuszeri]
MLKAKTRWKLATYDDQLAATIAEECQLTPLVSKLLVIRGIESSQKARDFLQAGPDLFHDPFLLDGMEQSVRRIRQAIADQEPICIYGDYDADGVSSTSLMVHVLRQLGAVFDYYIPNRFTEGYGLHKDALAQLQQSGYKLIITVDTGISAVEQVEYAKQLGLDVIVTDHHEPPAIIPEAFAVINPKKPGCSYPFDMLAGVGVAFKLGHALLGEPPLYLADLAALGTIADLVPLVDENRILAREGLKRLNHTRNLGLQALIRVCGLSDSDLSAGHVGFALGPRLNASGRLETAESAVKLLTTEDTNEAEACAQALDDLNCDRQDLVAAMTEEAVQMVKELYPPDEHNVLVVAKEGWNVGVVGIVASRLVETFYRPTIVLGIDPEKGTAKGSARSIAGFDMYEALTACKEWLPHYGGHTMAAGMTLPVENLDFMRNKLNELAGQWLSADDFIPLTKVDVSMDITQISLESVEQLEQLAPYGMGNPTPLVMLEDVETAGMRTIGRDDNHLKCSLSKSGTTVDAIGFNWAHVTKKVTPKARFQVLGELSVNEWNGNRKPQLTIRDLSVPHQQIFDLRGSRDKAQKWLQLSTEPGSITVLFHKDSYDLLASQATEEQRRALYVFEHENSESVFSSSQNVILYDLPKRRADFAAILTGIKEAERIYCMFGDPDLGMERLSCPGRQHFKELYQFFVQVPTVKHIHLDALARKLKWKRPLLDGMLGIFLELEFLAEESDHYRLLSNTAKRPLESSRLYMEWQEESQLATDLLLSSSEALLQSFHQLVESSTV